MLKRQLMNLWSSRSFSFSALDFIFPFFSLFGQEKSAELMCILETEPESALLEGCS